MDVARDRPALARWPASPGAPRLDLHRLLLLACAALAAYLALAPLGFLLWQSVHAPVADGAARFTLEHYRDGLLGAATPRLLANSLAYAGGAALLAFGLGAPLAWLCERTNAPLRRWFFALSLVPLIVPGILFVVAWMLLASPRIGVVNLALQALFGTDRVFVDVYSLAGMILVDGLHYSPLAFLMMGAAFRAMDPALEESALMSGASLAGVALRITLRLAWPAVIATLLILFVRALESFETPALLGLPAGVSGLTSAVFQATLRHPGDLGAASALAVALLAIASAGLWLQARLAARGSRHATVTGKGFRPRRLDLGRWRYPAGAVLAAYLVVLVGLPCLVLLWSSLQPYYAVPSLDGLARLTLDPYRQVLGTPVLATAVGHSVVLAAATATLVMLLTAVIAWIVVKSRLPGRWLLDHVASLPLAFPGVVLGLALMIVYLHVDLGVYGTLWILLIAYVTRFMPYGLRYATTSLLQIHRELEESAAMSGASWGATFRRVVLPLMGPGLLAGWIYVAILSVRELSSSILLYGPGSEVIAVAIFELWENGQYVELSALGVLLIVALLALAALGYAAARRVDAKAAPC